MLIAAIGVKLSSPGPIIFRQERVGKDKKNFYMYKFRSMTDARDENGELLPDELRLTHFGKVLRSTSLDELPELWNIFKGDMSIVGTRPPLISETNLYELHHYARLSIKPGITGLWQVSGRSDITDFEEVVRLDREYIDNWNVGMDIKILLKTVAVVLKKDGSM